MEKNVKESSPWVDFLKLGLLTVGSFFAAIVVVEAVRRLVGN